MQSFHTGSMAQGSVGEGMGSVRWPEGLLVGGAGLGRGAESRWSGAWLGLMIRRAVG